MNFIIKLFKTKNSTTRTQYNFILIIINKIIEYSHVLSYKEKHQNEFATFILKRLKKYYEISKNIIDN